MMSEQMRYITNEQGEQVGVLLDLETYNSVVLNRHRCDPSTCGITNSIGIYPYSQFIKPRL